MSAAPSPALAPSDCRPPLRARLLRAARILRRVRGWRRAVDACLPRQLSGAFVVENDGVLFSGELGSWIERETFLYGQYEADHLRLFLRQLARSRRRTLLDIGANAGTHSSVFARHFTAVHAFEPNPALWAQFERNMRINGYRNVELHRVGLGEQAADLPFHAPGVANNGLGTFLSTEQYSAPLVRLGTQRVERGDAYLAARGITDIDAIKVDVQGFEPQVLRGLVRTLATHRPAVWFELGAGTSGIDSWTGLQSLFPYPVTAFRFAMHAGLLTHRLGLRPTSRNGAMPEGDYLVLPA